MAFAVVAIIIAGIAQLYLGYVGIEDWLGSGWAIAAFALAIFARIMLPLTVGTYLAVTNVYGYDWWVGLIVAAPGLLLILPSMVADVFQKISGNAKPQQFAAFAANNQPAADRSKVQVQQNTSSASLSPNYSNHLKPGDLIKPYKGYGIYKHVVGVSVGEKVFHNVIEAERWITSEVNRLNVEAEKKKKSNDKSVSAVVSRGQSVAFDDEFLLETLRMYKSSQLSEAATLEIIKSKLG
jgi:hypothetical protein